MDKPKIHLTDVTGRDGFQMEKEWIETEDKIHILNRIIGSGIKRIEATSFVSPKAIPQLKDAKEVVRELHRDHVEVMALVPNLKGAELALDSGVDVVNVVLSISETHNKKNVNKTVSESLENVTAIHHLVRDQYKKLNVSLGTTFGCPFEGLYHVEKVSTIISKLHSEGINQITLADTTGMANPTQISRFVETLTKQYPDIQFSLHLHNTRGMGLVNLYAGYHAGIRHFDAALGGIGGCPFAPGATGNVCLEDIVHMLDLMNIPNDPDMNKLIHTSKELERILGYKLSGQVMKAGLANEVVPV
ncbi:hydroxymethylglutaryl-CoA lyase [Oceanobacillus senegalensis]|uniref:hydroxymethylglutaryl-CoA lyase n=1 Tax=Oceanobacillus senegalensis TaxID=1936063 RepID=UPI000A3116BF|nr:hydroxymethylglutaryl-CoA lyase [Oceanobacillus senegalensis]